MFSYSTGYYVSPPDDQYLKFKNRCSLTHTPLYQGSGSSIPFTNIISLICFQQRLYVTKIILRINIFLQRSYVAKIILHVQIVDLLVFRWPLPSTTYNTTSTASRYIYSTALMPIVSCDSVLNKLSISAFVLSYLINKCSLH